MTAEHWWTTRVQSVDEKHLRLNYINPKHDAFDDIKKPNKNVPREKALKRLRSQLEKNIRNNIKDPELFLDDKEFPEVFTRISTEDYDALGKLLEEYKIKTSE